MACAMRRREFGEAAIRAALTTENAARCRPPLKDDEVHRIARSAMRYASEGAIVEAAGVREIAASDVTARPIRWLWRWRLAAGKLTILDGDPDVGKTLLLVELAARVTTARPMPDGSPGLGEPR